MGEATHVPGQGTYGKSLYLLLNSAVNLELLFKITFFFFFEANKYTFYGGRCDTPPDPENETPPS